ncbi:hypothetical protein K439DRAFT_324109 [Ramaria rubella]|nr:hypothetical protein K439DRAFT_324109 [Ramaria rubella]
MGQRAQMAVWYHDMSGGLLAEYLSALRGHREMSLSQMAAVRSLVCTLTVGQTSKGIGQYDSVDTFAKTYARASPHPDSPPPASKYRIRLRSTRAPSPPSAFPSTDTHPHRSRRHIPLPDPRSPCRPRRRTALLHPRPREHDREWVVQDARDRACSRTRSGVRTWTFG